MQVAKYQSPAERSELINENLKNRQDLLIALNNKNLAAQIKQKCANDFCFWLTNFCWTYDPRPSATMSELPFIPFERQRVAAAEIIGQINAGEDVLIDKSRDMGATWLICYIFQWFWQFGGAGNNFHFGSKKLDNVDKLGDLSSILEKIRFNIKRQPKAFMPQGFSETEHLAFCRLQNPENGNIITGESANQDFGRSGRYKAVCLDEFAFWDWASQAWTASSQSTMCRIPLSTPRGKTNKFAKLRFGTKDTPRVKKIISLHWSEHPHKTKDLKKLEDGTYTSEWYEEQKTKLSSQEMAQEIDIDYDTSRVGAVYRFSDKIHVVSGLRNKILKLETPLIERVWDFGLNPAVLFFAKHPYGTRLLFELTPDDRPTTSKLCLLVQEISETIFKGCTFDDVCDVAGNQTNRQTHKTDIEILNAHGFYPHNKQVPIEDGIKVVQEILDRPQGFEIDADCVNTIGMFNGGYYRAEDKTGQGREMQPVEVHPFEDVADCVRYHFWRHFRTPFENRQNKKYTKVHRGYKGIN